MGLNATILIAENTLTDADLAGMDLHPADEQLSAEAVLLTPSEDRACVVRADDRTIIIDGSDALAEAVDEERITLPGRVVSAAAVSTVDFSDFRIIVDGQVVRHLRQEEGEITIDRGDAVAGESEFLVPTDAEDDEAGNDEGAEAGTVRGGVEIDGDLLIERSPILAGMSADTDLFALAGMAYRRAPDPDHRDDEPASAPAETAKRGFFSRLFGR